ncbi:hypothetical protein RCL_jg13721.t1 [Rhizophagus clarus]|uniref:Uncharacterized protein n=1 Tax=Rhizophagus clarus TaxID=94130 RepID=A0A8H3MC22_9GLOM|nr:hypothetical protein RCL_jg13721.t1 [Rhizophagus clarus]
MSQKGKHGLTETFELTNKLMEEPKIHKQKIISSLNFQAVWQPLLDTWSINYLLTEPLQGQVALMSIKSQQKYCTVCLKIAFNDFTLQAFDGESKDGTRIPFVYERTEFKWHRTSGHPLKKNSGKNSARSSQKHSKKDSGAQGSPKSSSKPGSSCSVKRNPPLRIRIRR